MHGIRGGEVYNDECTYPFFGLRSSDDASIAKDGVLTLPDGGGSVRV